MKTNRITKFAALATTLALTLGIVGSALAQFKATGDDGITASPKAREFLDEYNRNHTAVVAPAETQTMKCGMCKNVVTRRIDYTVRGANKPTIAVATHLCKMCDTELKTIGVGKAAKTSVIPEEVRQLLPRLRDGQFTKVIVVTLPEATPVHEAAALQDDLRRAQIEPFAWVINQSFAESGSRDPLLVARGRGEGQFIREVTGKYSRRTALVSWVTAEPVGAEGLQQLFRAATVS